MDIFGSIKRFAGDIFDRPKTIEPGVYGPGGSPTGSGVGQAQQILSDIDPGLNATRETIFLAEGTWDPVSQSPDYSMRFGDQPGAGTLDITQPHPMDTRGSGYGSSYASNASGAYQFMAGGSAPTWQEMNNGSNAVMSPSNQDAAAERLISERTNYDTDEPFRDQAHELSGQWASIPNRSGRSSYGQPVKDLDNLSAFHEDRMDYWERERNHDVWSRR